MHIYIQDLKSTTGNMIKTNKRLHIKQYKCMWTEGKINNHTTLLPTT
jgi:hypothetical protein